MSNQNTKQKLVLLLLVFTLFAAFVSAVTPVECPDIVCSDQYCYDDRGCMQCCPGVASCCDNKCIDLDAEFSDPYLVMSKCIDIRANVEAEHFDSCRGSYLIEYECWPDGYCHERVFSCIDNGHQACQQGRCMPASCECDWTAIEIEYDSDHCVIGTTTTSPIITTTVPITTTTLPGECYNDSDCGYLNCIQDYSLEAVGYDTPICCNGECICGGYEGSESEETCNDYVNSYNEEGSGFDNDCDGFANCFDSACYDAEVCKDHECSDNICKTYYDCVYCEDYGDCDPEYCEGCRDECDYEGQRECLDATNSEEVQYRECGYWGDQTLPQQCLTWKVFNCEPTDTECNMGYCYPSDCQDNVCTEFDCLYCDLYGDCTPEQCGVVPEEEICDNRDNDGDGDTDEGCDDDLDDYCDDTMGYTAPDCGCYCLDIYDPVCGVDGKTYSNDCYRGCAGVAKKHDGECTTTTTIPVTSTTISNCYDSDGGINFYQYGECTNNPVGDSPASGDYCEKFLFFFQTGNLIEYDCKGQCYTIKQNCAELGEGLYCKDGVCVSDTTVSCVTNGDCNTINNAGTYCKKTPSDCDGIGICATKPTQCTEEVSPVCGCDGITYGNACIAALSGVNVDYEGECAIQTPVPPACDDPDEDDYYTKGTCESGGVKHTDTCTGVYTLREWVCSDLDSSVCTSTTVDCRSLPDINGAYICEDGACVLSVPPIQCTDTDHGKYPETYGTCTDPTGDRINSDVCLPSRGDIREYYCSGNICRYEDMRCGDLGSYECLGGECVETVPIIPGCDDSDGEDYRTYGTCTDMSGERVDVCVDANTVKEWVCTDLDSSVCTYKIKDCRTLPDINGITGNYECKDGRCVVKTPVPPACDDPDEDDYYTKGTCESGGVKHTDTCTGVYTLREWVCSDLDSSVCTSTTVDCSKIPDAKGLICMNGICTQNLCSKCGEGLFNICDKEECSSLGQHCTYTAGIFGGTCIYRM